MMGRVLLRMVVNRGKDEEKKDLRIFSDLTDFAERLAKDFVVKGRKLTLEEFWNEELSVLPGRKMEEIEKEEKDVLEMEEVILVTHMVESNMLPLIKIPGFSP